MKAPPNINPTFLTKNIILQLNFSKELYLNVSNNKNTYIIDKLASSTGCFAVTLPLLKEPKGEATCLGHYFSDFDSVFIVIDRL